MFDPDVETQLDPGSVCLTVRRAPATLKHVSDFSGIVEQLSACRSRSMELTTPLTIEDQMAQANPEASPTKWHLAHTTWFFETFVLKPFLPSYRPYSEDFDFCFNSYYESFGNRLARDSRGLLTRPSLGEIHKYRSHVDSGLSRLSELEIQNDSRLQNLLELGIAHEQQHQELMLTDILALFAAQPLLPAYKSVSLPARDGESQEVQSPSAMIDFAGGIVKTGHSIENGFAFDNECPEHTCLIHPFRIASNLVTNGDWLEFINDKGYSTTALWLSDGWAWTQKNRISSPGYWHLSDEGWQQMTLLGRQPINHHTPVCQVSFYEADAFAKWSGKRLPTEFEWEHAVWESAREISQESGWDSEQFISDLGKWIPASADATRRDKLKQAFGDVWQWTSSPYMPYPGYCVAQGAVGEYNGKFMCSQMTLRGSSFATPPGHARITYRNFFYPHQRWQFTGLRLAEDSK